MVNNNATSPRQKMINLMYLVFIAMLALNVSAEVLNGFDIVSDSLHRSSENMYTRNRFIMDELERYNVQNSEKAGEWYEKGQEVKQLSDSLVHFIENLKIQIVRQSDGKNGDVNNIRNRDNLDAASSVMLAGITGEGQKLRAGIDNYRQTVSALVIDANRREIIEQNLSTKPSSRSDSGKNWEQSLFEKMPVSAAVTILTKLQNDIRASEGDALSSLLNSVDVGDFRVNQINAYVIPESRVIIQGGTYNARIVLSAEDSTQTPAVFVNGQTLNPSLNGLFTAATGSVGTFPVEGFIEVPGGDGSVMRRDFSDSYTVIEPMATIAPTLMNVLYAGIDNEISISVPGITPQDVSATMTNGSLIRKGNLWIAKPSAVGRDATISISARTGTQTRQVASKSFRVRALPDPTPYIEYTDANGNPAMFKGGALTKNILVNAPGIKAAIDDGILNIPFRVTSFRTVFFDSMGNAIPEISDGNRFSERQMEQIRRLQRGRYFYISGVRAIGPDGTEREIAVIEVRVN
ncbi:MAG: gliding motility protein GldM [Bacteroidia bacterium]|nr:gliding motility protein GldM [Bacteroidia bacterium]